MQSFQRLERALWLPRVDGSVFGEWLTEVVAFLWPLLLTSPQELTGCRCCWVMPIPRTRCWRSCIA